MEKAHCFKCWPSIFCEIFLTFFGLPKKVKASVGAARIEVETPLRGGSLTKHVAER